MIEPSAPVALNRPAKGALMPPNASHGELVCRSCSRWVAAAAVIGCGLLPPSM